MAIVLCPFEDVPDLNQMRAQLVALWHEERRLRLLNEKAEQERQALLVKLDEAHTRIEKLKAKLAGARSKGAKNRSERRGRTGHNNDRDKGKGKDTGKGDEDDEPEEGHGPTDQPHIEQQDLPPFDLDDADKACTACGGHLEEWIGHEDTSVLIEVIERRFVCQNITQKKYRCSCGNGIETALGPERLLPNGRYSVSFAIEVAYDKYMLHSPLERQAREMTRQGLIVESQTLWDQTWALSRLLLPAYEAVHHHVLSGPWVAADETTWWMMRTKHSPPELKQGEWYIWIAHRPDAAFYLIRPTRDDKAAKELLSLPVKGEGGEVVLGDDGKPKRTPYRGKVLCDGWWAYKHLAKNLPRLTLLLVHCWSHVRREVLPCEKSFPKESAKLLDLIAELYMLEREAPKGREGDAVRLQVRQTRSSEVLERIGGWVFTHALKFPPESDMRKAAQYMVNHWEGLTRFLSDAELPLDNNDVEKDCRQPVLGKRNHYGSRSERGTETAAILYTLVQSAKLSGIEPKTYLRVAALRQLRGRSVLLPHQVEAEHLREELCLSESEIERVLARRTARAAPANCQREPDSPSKSPEPAS